MSRRGQRGDEDRRKSCGKNQFGHSSLLMGFLFSGPVRNLIDGNPSPGWTGPRRTTPACRVVRPPAFGTRDDEPRRIAVYERVHRP